MKQLFFLLVVTSIAISSNAQNTATLKGKIIDSIGKQSLKDASITVLDATDSTLEAFTLALQDGSFTIQNIAFGEMIIQIKFQGYETISKEVTFSKERSVVDIGVLSMVITTNDLGNVTVTQSPIQMKKDTVEFNASAFKTKPNAATEDLLKKIPGVQIDKDGTIKAQGEQVQRVLVDGKRFFGDDPKLATKNLPSDIIDKIQVFDAASDQSAFTGFDDGNSVKTINITTRKDKRKGYFGKGTLGVGANQQETVYDNSINLSKFDADQQITLLGQANNVNKQNFSIQDILGTQGGGNQRGGGGNARGGGGNRSFQGPVTSGAANGLVKTLAGGLNFRDTWGSKTQFSGSYFYNNQNTYQTQNSYTQNFVGSNPDSTQYNDQLDATTNKSQNHRINMNIEHQFDSANSLIIRPNVSFQKTNSITEQQTFSTLGKIYGLNNSIASAFRENQGINGSIDATFRHRFPKRGRTYSIFIRAGSSTNDGSGSNYSENNYSPINRPAFSDTIDQVYTSNRDAHNYSTTFSYTEPIGKNQLIEFNINNSYSKNTSGKNTLEFNPSSLKYDIPVVNLSNIFENTFSSNRLTMNYRVQNEKYNLSIGSGVQIGDLNSYNVSTATTLKQNYTNLFPAANFRYNFSKTKSLRIFYNGRTAQPTAEQLQPVIDNSNPLFIKTGNPLLKQQFSHSFRFLYNSFNVSSQKLLFATINASFIQDDIQTATTLNRDGSQLSQPVNLSGTYNISSFLNYGFPIRKPKSNFNLIANVSRNQSQSLINGKSNYTRNTTFGGTASWTTNLKERFDMNFSANSSFNMARYTLQPAQNGDFFTQTGSAEATYYTKSGWIFFADFDYIYNGGRSAGYNTSIPLLNASISKQVFKNKAGEVKLYVFDLLNQNVSVTRNVTGATIQDVQTNVLSRYFMVSFVYNLRKFGANAQQNNRQGPGGFNRPMEFRRRGD